MIQFEICFPMKDGNQFLFPTLRSKGFPSFSNSINSNSKPSIWIGVRWNLSSWITSLFCQIQVRLCSTFGYKEIYSNYLKIVDLPIGNEAILLIQDINSMDIIVKGPQPILLKTKIVKIIQDILPNLNLDLVNLCPNCVKSYVFADLEKKSQIINSPYIEHDSQKNIDNYFCKDHGTFTLENDYPLEEEESKLFINEHKAKWDQLLAELDKILNDQWKTLRIRLASIVQPVEWDDWPKVVATSTCLNSIIGKNTSDLQVFYNTISQQELSPEAKNIIDDSIFASVFNPQQHIEQDNNIL